jgi:hypothetical protein
MNNQRLIGTVLTEGGYTKLKDFYKFQIHSQSNVVICISPVHVKLPSSCIRVGTLRSCKSYIFSLIKYKFNVPIILNTFTINIKAKYNSQANPTLNAVSVWIKEINRRQNNCKYPPCDFFCHKELLK